MEDHAPLLAAMTSTSIRASFGISPVDGLTGTCPETNTNAPASMACEYGPSAAGAVDVEMAFMSRRFLSGPDDAAGFARRAGGERLGGVP